eukprot:360885-Chlamydomonas_euryale.AAC.1
MPCPYTQLQDKAMHGLQGASEQIPSLAAAIHATHANVLALVSEAADPHALHHPHQQLQQPPAMLSPGQAAAAAGPSAAARTRSVAASVPTWYGSSPLQTATGREAAAQQPAAHFGTAPAALFAGGVPGSTYGVGTVPLPALGQPQAASLDAGFGGGGGGGSAGPGGMYAYSAPRLDGGGLGDPLMAAAAAASAMPLSMPAGLRDAHARTADVSSQMNVLEDNLRWVARKPLGTARLPVRCCPGCSAARAMLSGLLGCLCDGLEGMWRGWREGMWRGWREG